VVFDDGLDPTVAHCPLPGVDVVVFLKHDGVVRCATGLVCNCAKRQPVQRSLGSILYEFNGSTKVTV
jgi:hypothetical protein